MIPTVDPTFGAPISAVEVDIPYNKKYDLSVDEKDRALEIKLGSAARPHMRAFHVDWLSFFFSFWLWFAFTSLLDDVQRTMGLTDSEVWITTCLSMTSPVLWRMVCGPLLEWSGARVAQAVILTTTSLPVMLGGLATNFVGLCVVRFAIGITAASFVCCQVWSSSMFSDNVMGTANAITAGWGTIGAPFALLVMWYLNEGIQAAGVTPDDSWRYALILPGTVAMMWGLLLAFISDDAPRTGTKTRLRDVSRIGRVAMQNAARRGARNPNTWLLALQYAASYGVELHLYNSLHDYFMDEFGVSTTKAILITSLFGFFNIFSRPLGGWLSDRLAARYGLRGRVVGHSASLLVQGGLLGAFAVVRSLAAALVILSLLSIVVQAAEGMGFGLVPLVEPLAMPTVSGVVAAGGSLGAAMLAAATAAGASYEAVYGGAAVVVVLVAIFPTFMINIRGHTAFGKPPSGLAATLDVPGAW